MDAAEGAPSVSVKWQDLGVRTASALALIPAVLLDIWLGGIWFHLFVALLCVMMAYEWTVIVHERSSSQFALHAAAALCGVFLLRDVGIGGSLLAIASLGAFSAAIAQYQGRPITAWTYLGVFYCGLPAAALVILRDDPAFGITAMVWLFAAIWAADILAYFAGRIIGGPKLWPAVSPKKTWAGLGGAVAGGALAGAAVSLWIGQTGIWILAMIGALLGLVEQGGDLFESALKRRYGVKDSGRLIPGHGGVLDRVDGLVAAAMVAALLGASHRGADAAGAGLLLW
jgi:phosphatidate cytidylyltransferase